MILALDIDQFLFWDAIVPFLIPLCLSLCIALAFYCSWIAQSRLGRQNKWQLIGFVVWASSAGWFAFGLISDMWLIAGNPVVQRPIYKAVVTILGVVVICGMFFWIISYFVLQSREKSDDA
jgi:hypothetical protein